MREIGAFEAERKFGEMLGWVEHGEEVTITRYGKEVARLVPARPEANRDDARAALARIRARAEQGKLGSFDWSDWKAYRDEGRPRPSSSIVLRHWRGFTATKPRQRSAMCSTRLQMPEPSSRRYGDWRLPTA